MGERGAVPKRSHARRRRNKTDEAGGKYIPDRVNLQKFDGELHEPDPPAASWHPAARAIWDAALESGERIFWEPSDWAILRLTCSQVSQEYATDLIIEKVKLPMENGQGGGEELVFGSRPMPAGKFAAIMKVMGDLGMTEGGRRRMRIELERNWTDTEDESVPIEQGRMALLQGGKGATG
ncbi:MAG: hypothetical protein M3Q39_10055 [Actinomycetota bacterium]|nr:hypothetical protein [Actinomycetota bacterium]